MAEEFKTFEELGITESPYVLEYKEKYGKPPVLAPITATRLPTRFKTSSGGTRYSMKESYRTTARLRVLGTEPGKRKPDAVNIVLAHPDNLETHIVVTPEDMIRRLHVVVGTPAEVVDPARWFGDAEIDDVDRMDDIPDPMETVKPVFKGGEVKQLLEKRKKEAKVSI
jgi:hypothetical protein